MGAAAGGAAPRAQRALTAAFQHPVGRFEQHGEVAGQPVRVLAGDVAEAVVDRLDLFAVVEHEGQVVRRRGSVGGADGGGRGQLHGDARLHVGGAAAVQHVAFET